MEAIASGDLDGGWPSTRAFAEAGIDGLQRGGGADDDHQLRRGGRRRRRRRWPRTCWTSSRARASPASGSRSVRCGGRSRRRHRCSSPPTGAASPFRSYNSPVQADAISALGGEPKNIGTEWPDAVAAGELRRRRVRPGAVPLERLGRRDPVRHRERRAVAEDVRPEPQRGAVRLALRRAARLRRSRRSRGGRGVGGRPLRRLRASPRSCATSASGSSTPTPIRSTRCSEALAPVVQELADDPSTGPILEAIQAIAEEHPDAEPIDVPDDCGTAAPDGGTSIPDEPSAAAGRDLPGRDHRRRGRRLRGEQRPGVERHVDASPSTTGSTRTPAPRWTCPARTAASSTPTAPTSSTPATSGAATGRCTSCPTAS